MSDCNRLVRDIHFIIWAIMMIVNIIGLIIWLTSEGFLISNTVFVTKLFLYNSIPAYTVVLIGVFLVSLMGEQPQLGTYKIFDIPGIVLFLLAGIFLLVNYFDSPKITGATTILILGILALVNCGLFIFDLITNIKQAGCC